jgi:carbon-monoxide dehydrogenase iron sulfur subunit
VYIEAAMNGHFEIFKMPMTCRHCDPAPCILACIPQVMHRTAEGVVTNVGGNRTCIACGMCVMMCPFGMVTRAPDLSGKVMAIKCDLCPGREIPACAASCPTGAIIFASGDEFASQHRQRASAQLSQARHIRESTLTQTLEE